MLAVILTKSFRCLCFILSKVYKSLFFCVLELCFLVQPVYGLPMSYLLSKGPFQRYKETRKHWTYANGNGYNPSQLRGFRAVNNIPLMQVF